MVEYTHYVLLITKILVIQVLYDLSLCLTLSFDHLDGHEALCFMVDSFVDPTEGTLPYCIFDLVPILYLVPILKLWKCVIPTFTGPSTCSHRTSDRTETGEVTIGI